MKRTKHLIAACAALCVTVYTASAQPANDLCADVVPVALEAGSTIFLSGNNEDATIDGDNVPGSGLDDFGIAVVWAAFTTTECADVSISFCGSTAPFLSSYFWEVLAYDCPADQLVISPSYNNDDCADGQPTIYFNELAAGTYYYPVWSQPGTSIGDYEIAISAVACGATGPANDTCAGAEEHSLAIGDMLTITGDNTGATNNDGLGLPVVWESFTLAECADVTIDHCGSDLTLNLLAIGIFMDCPATMYLDTTVIDTCPDGNLIMVFNDLAPGTYWVPVAMALEGEAGPYTMHISAASCTGGPANDLCQGAELHELAVDDTLVITGDNTGATDSEGMGIANVWESFTLSECADVELSLCGTSPDLFALVPSIFTDCPGTNEITPDDFDTCPDGNMLVNFTGLAPGTYWMPVIMITGEEGPYTLTLSAAACSVATPPNDLCEDAAPIAVVAPDSCAAGAVIGDNLQATGSGALPHCAEPGVQWQDLWYVFNAGDAEEVTITLEAGTMEGGGMEVFGACGDSIVCSLDGEPIELDVQPDSTYRVRVFTLEDGTPGTFVLCVTSDGTTGIGSSNAGSVLVYPNPGTGDFHFTPSIAWADASIRVLDVTGRTIHAEQADLRAGEPYPLLLSGKMKVGSYFLHISGPAGNSVIKLMVK